MPAANLNPPILLGLSVHLSQQYSLPLVRRASQHSVLEVWSYEVC
jgi:hypothetical protein